MGLLLLPTASLVTADGPGRPAWGVRVSRSEQPPGRAGVCVSGAALWSRGRWDAGVLKHPVAARHPALPPG